ncbi:MAG: rod shape-determining protein MreC [Oscillospiraceae bacterium]|nr:rod shape-determining protein MreC [Oscillospiraceae bacterium]
MKHFFSTRVRVVLVIAILLAVGLAVISDLTGLSVPDMVVKGVLTPIRSGASRLADGAQRIYNYVFEYESLAAENAALKEQLAEMEDEARRADSVSRENSYLRSVIGLKENNPSWELVDAYVISRSSQEWSSTFTVSRGSNAGIKEGMCAITANGEVVGLVSEVGSNYAQIKSVMDSSLEISSTISASGYNGMVQGGYASGLNGLLRMNYLPSSAVIRNNDQVVTSGSMVYPRNLIVGYVVDAGFDDAGVAKYALLKPAVDVGNLELVFIVTQYDAG